MSKNIKIIDISNQKFGKLTAIRVTDKRDNFKRRIWECICDCGILCEIPQHNLRSGNSKSCGCDKNTGKNFRSNVGKRFGRLLVKERIKIKKGIVHYNCLCDCGNTCIVSNAHLISEKTKSCGCLAKETSIENMKNMRSMFPNEGVGHQRWNKNLSEEDRKKKRGNDFKLWSNFIMKRDDFTCQKCNCRGCKLNAHHLDAWSINKEMRLNPMNGVSLCVKCHRELHTKFGTKPTVNDSLSFLGFPIDNEYFTSIENFDFDIIKYACRWKDKGKIEDLNKIKEYVDILIKNEENGE